MLDTVSGSTICGICKNYVLQPRGVKCCVCKSLYYKIYVSKIENCTATDDGDIIKCCGDNGENTNFVDCIDDIKAINQIKNT